MQTAECSLLLILPSFFSHLSDTDSRQRIWVKILQRQGSHDIFKGATIKGVRQYLDFGKQVNKIYGLCQRHIESPEWQWMCWRRVAKLLNEKCGTSLLAAAIASLLFLSVLLLQWFSWNISEIEATFRFVWLRENWPRWLHVGASSHMTFEKYSIK